MATMTSIPSCCSTTFHSKIQPVPRPHSRKIVCEAGRVMDTTRRRVLQTGVLLLSPLLHVGVSYGKEQPTTDLCDASCLTKLAEVAKETTSSGLQYQDVVPGRGPLTPVGYQAVAHVITMNQEGLVVDSTFDRSQPFDIRVGAGQVVAGLDEGIRTMKVGGIRRLYVPADLAFQKSLKAAPGRPRIEAKTPLVIDVQLLYVPGLDLEEE